MEGTSVRHDPEDREAVTRIAEETALEMEIRDGKPVLLIDGITAGNEIRGPEGIRGGISCQHASRGQAGDGPHTEKDREQGGHRSGGA